MDIKTIINFAGMGMIGLGLVIYYFKRVLKVDMLWILKEKLLGHGYPVRTIMLKKLAGKTYVLDFDKEKRQTKKGMEEMKNLKSGNVSPPVDYSVYIPDKLSRSWELCMETDKGERYPLLPLTYDDIFVYDKEGKLVEEGEQPILRDSFLGIMDNRKPNDVIGLHALSKGRREWYLARMEKSILKHPMKKDRTMLWLGIGVVIVMVAVGLIIFFRGLPGVAEAGGKIAGAASGGVP